MEKRDLVNICFGRKTDFFGFEIGQYRFEPKRIEQEKADNFDVTKMGLRVQLMFRKNVPNAWVQSNSFQNNSILVDPEIITTNDWARREADELDDILILGSLLTGNNWAVAEENMYPPFPVKRANWLFHHLTLGDQSVVVTYLQKALSRISDPSWRTAYQSTHHLLTTLMVMNINSQYLRFSSCLTIWELLYESLPSKLPMRYGLRQKMFELLEYYWNVDVLNGVFCCEYKNIFYFLRNQIVHEGNLPITRPDAEQWMKDLDFRAARGGNPDTLRRYLEFFDLLTLVLVMKTVGLDLEAQVAKGTFLPTLRNFFKSGKVVYVKP